MPVPNVLPAGLPRGLVRVRQRLQGFFEGAPVLFIGVTLGVAVLFRLAIPFLLTALAFGRMTTAFAFVRRHYGAVIGIGGAVLITMGVLIWTGEFFRLNIEAQNLLRKLGLDFWNSV